MEIAKKRNWNWVYYLIALYLIFDFAFSFFQHYNIPLDGDLPGGILPAKDVKPILNDPFGISVITQNSVYPNPNRFFAHWSLFSYFNIFPFLLQKIVNPIESLYLASAIIKIFIQFGFIFIIGRIITNFKKIGSRDFILACFVITPLFQINGYQSYMGIIDKSITYTFFYALPTLLLLFFYIPFVRYQFNSKQFIKSKLVFIFYLIAAIVLTLNGPLNTGIILTISFLFSLNILYKANQSNTNKNLIGNIKFQLNTYPKYYLLILFFISLMSIYSLFIGLNNSVLIKESIPILERYSRLPIGLYYILSQKIGFPILIILLIINYSILKKSPNIPNGRLILSYYKWILLFAFFYILFLPLGGYKEYRPNIIRFDTFIPITLSLLFLYGYGTFNILQNSSSTKLKWYIPLIILISFIYTFADKPEFEQNDCQKTALEIISKSKNKYVVLKNDCLILSWDKIENYNDSKLNTILLKKWNITSKITFYKQN